MGWFDPPWLKLHRQICDQYEEIAFRDHAQNPRAEIDVTGVVARVLQKELRMSAPDACTMTHDLYAAFLNFPVRSAVEESLRRQKPDIPDKGVDDIFLALKAKFLDTQYEHIYFVYFVISYLLAAGDYGITRGDYFMKVGLNAIPDDKSLSRLRKLTRRFASFLEAEDKGTQPTRMSRFAILVWSFRKSSRLRRIARILTPQPDGGESLMRTFAQGGFDAIEPRLDDVERGKKELFALLRDDPVTNAILLEHNISDSDLKELYDNLVRHGAGIFTKGHWIPASALAYGQTLGFLLKHRGDGDGQFREVCSRLWHYFSNNETGEIEE
jgi:hypothetical protein